MCKYILMHTVYTTYQKRKMVAKMFQVNDSKRESEIETERTSEIVSQGGWKKVNFDSITIYPLICLLFQLFIPYLMLAAETKRND